MASFVKIPPPVSKEISRQTKCVNNNGRTAGQTDDLKTYWWRRKNENGQRVDEVNPVGEVPVPGFVKQQVNFKPLVKSEG